MAEKKTKDSVRALGRRKRASARVRMEFSSTPGITVNGKPLEKYFVLPSLQETVSMPLRVVDKEKTFAINVRVVGGGIHGQAEAARHGIARALLAWNPELRKTLKTQGFLTRDPREKERKKPGLKKARRAPQWSKR